MLKQSKLSKYLFHHPHVMGYIGIICLQSVSIGGEKHELNKQRGFMPQKITLEDESLNLKVEIQSNSDWI